MMDEDRFCAESIQYNKDSLEELAFAIEMSQGQFSLILAKCNYSALRECLVQRLREICPKIREIHLEPSVTKLYSKVREVQGDKQLPGLMISGLESVKDIKQLLLSLNPVREEFRKHCQFAVVLWVNDDIVRQFKRLIPDFESWTTRTLFEISANELLDFLRQGSEHLFSEILEAGATRFLPHEFIFGSRYQELESALRDLENYGEQLSPDLEACLQFCRGRDAYGSDQINKALNLYQQSLIFWQQEAENRDSKTEKSEQENPKSDSPVPFLSKGGSQNPKLREAVLLFHIGLGHYRKAELYRSESQDQWEEARSYFQQCLDVFEQAQRSDLVAKFIVQLGEVLRRLEDWEELDDLAQKAINLHEEYQNQIYLAQDYGFLADVALHQQSYILAKDMAEIALRTLGVATEEQRQHQNRYLLLLARSLRGMGQVEKAIANLKKAQESDPQDNPKLYIEILNELRSLYFDQHQYLEAFEIKQKRRSIEQQFGFRAFIGAGYLQPQKQNRYALSHTEHEETVAPEIVASGRKRDVERLIKMISKPQHKLTVIHGQSGVGKTSLVNAGLVPKLTRRSIGTRDVLPILLRVYTDWAKELGKLLAQALEEKGITLPSIPDSAATIIEQLGQNEARNLLTVLIFDQFEEFFFVSTEPSKRKQFFEFLGNCLNINGGVKVILSLREDYLHYLLMGNCLPSMAAINNDLLSKNVLYSVGNFAAPDAKELIHNLTESSQFPFDPDLVNEIVQELADEMGEVRPIELQIVGAQMQTEKITTLAQYRKLGPKDQLVQRYLEEVVKDCGTKNYRAAELVLYLLTDENDTRPRKTRAELERELKELAADFLSEAEKLDLILDIFVKSGLVFLLREIPANRYQLVHDYLVTLIRQAQKAGLLKQISEQKAEIENLRRQKEEYLEKELRRAKKQRLGAAIVALVMTILGGTAAYQANQTAIAEMVARSSLSLSNLFSGNQLKALIDGVKAGRQLQKVKASFETEIATLGTLQQVIYNVQEFNRLEGHISWVNSVSFSPNGEMIASASADNTVKLWRKNGEFLRTLEGHNSRVNSVSFSPDGQIIASGSDDKTIKLWNLKGEELKNLEGHNSSVNSVSFSPNGEMIASASDDNTVKLWRKNGELLRTLEGHQDRVKAVSFSPDGNTIASASWDKTVKIWDLDGNLPRTLPEKDKVTTVSFSPDGKTIASGSWDNTIKIWNLKGNLLQTLKGHNNNVTSISFSPNGKMIASVSYDEIVKLWRMEEEYQEFLESKTLDIGDVISVSFSPDGRTLALTGADNNIRLWSLAGIQPTTLKHDDSVTTVSFSPDGSMIVSASDDGAVKLWTSQGNLLQTLQGHDSSVISLSFSPDGKMITSASDDGRIKFWSLDSDEVKQSKDLPLKLDNNALLKDVSFSPDGKKIVSVIEDQQKITVELPDGKKIISVIPGKTTVKLWEDDGNLLETLLSEDEGTTVSFSPDGQMIASGSLDTTIIIWNLEGKKIKTLKGHTGSISSVSFSPDGQMIASGSLDTTIIIWSLEGKEKLTLTDHTSAVFSVGFLRDGKILASGSTDGTIKLWNVKDGILLANLERSRSNTAVVNGMSVSPNDKIIASANADNTVILWNFDLDELLKRSCDWLNDYLSTNPNVNSAEQKICP